MAQLASSYQLRLLHLELLLSTAGLDIQQAPHVICRDKESQSTSIGTYLVKPKGDT